MNKIHLLDQIFSSIIHGVFLFIFTILFTFFIVSSHSTIYSIIAVGIFAISVLFLYTMSVLYHSLFFTRARKVFALLDQSAIFIIIAGTYTPFLLLAIEGKLKILLLTIIWITSFIGIFVNNVYREKYKHLSLSLYLILGWVALIIGKELYMYDKPIYFFLLIGGLSYTLGVFFYLKKDLFLHHTVWHGFVIGGTVFHSLAVLSLI